MSASNVSPSIIFIIGPSASGKTTIGEALAERLNWKFEDADDYHSEVAKQKMRDAQKLTDADRMPWLGRIQNVIIRYRNEHTPVVFACSALKNSYRKVLSGDLSPKAILNPDAQVGIEDHASSTNTCDPKRSPDSNAVDLTAEGKSIPVYFLLLKASFDTLYKRLETRKNHYFPPELLASQLEALEIPDHTESVRSINAEQPIDETVNECLTEVEQLTSLHIHQQDHHNVS